MTLRVEKEITASFQRTIFLHEINHITTSTIIDED